MANTNTSLNRLTEHLFDTIERVKDITDPEASPEDKANLEGAKQISNLASQIISISKLKLDAVKLVCRYDDIKGMKILNETSLLKIENKTTES